LRLAVSNMSEDTSGSHDVEVSIVIPCFNRAGLVEEAISSALGQGAGIEVIVVDDGSTDDSWAAIKRFGSRIRAFRTENRGVSAARNFAIGHARGTFIRFLDSDDRAPENAVATLLAASRKMPPYHIAVGDGRSIDAAGNRVEGPRYGYAHLAPPGPIASATLIGTPMSPCLALFPSEALRKSGAFDERLSLGEDHELALRLARAGYTFVRIPIVVHEIRVHQLGRLSRNIGSAGDGKLLAAYETIWRGYAADGGMARDERGGLGRLVWRMGRNAARHARRAEAERLFRLARTIAGSDAVSASRIFRLLYLAFPSYRAERVGEAMKKLFRRAR
jgi:glycosyltransferase involved in cell wall biosynthesis